MNNKKLILVSLFMLSINHAIAEQLSCFSKGDVMFGFDGNKPEVNTYKDSDRSNPENWVFFDFDTGETMFVYSDGNKKYRVTEKIEKINPQLYYSRVSETDYVGYSTYLFSERLNELTLTESGFTAYFDCAKASIKDTQRKYGFSLEEYKLR